VDNEAYRVQKTERQLAALAVRKWNQRMDRRLNHIAAMCGNPNAAQGCRNILDYIDEIRRGEEAAT
jgi:hypothetical protein